MSSFEGKLSRPILSQPEVLEHPYNEDMVSWQVDPRSQITIPVIAQTNLSAFSLETEGKTAYGRIFFSAFNNSYNKNWGRSSIAKYVLATETGIAGFLPEVADELYDELKAKTIRVTAVGDRNIEVWGNFCENLFAAL